MEMIDEKLIDQVIAQIVADIEAGDTTALSELLMRVNENVLKSYLPEEMAK